MENMKRTKYFLRIMIGMEMEMDRNGKLHIKGTIIIVIVSNLENKPLVNILSHRGSTEVY